MENILKEIIKSKKADLKKQKSRFPIKELKTGLNDFPVKNFRKSIQGNKVSIIGEIKKASPSAGLICEDFNVIKLASDYKKSGVSALSILTEKDYFQGDIEYLKMVKSKINIPVLRKDFIIDEYQVYEARYFGADAILLIAAVLDRYRLRNLNKIARSLSMDVLVEIHNDEELERISDIPFKIIGINNRDLRTFKTNLQTTIKLASKLPKGVTIVSESGINNAEDIKTLKRHGVNAVLIGESIMRSPDIKKKVSELMRGC